MWGFKLVLKQLQNSIISTFLVQPPWIKQSIYTQENFADQKYWEKSSNLFTLHYIVYPTRMTTFIVSKLNNSDCQTNVNKHRVTMLFKVHIFFKIRTKI